jgi:hypothetical protein
MKNFIASLILTIIIVTNAYCCFGPELIIGYEQNKIFYYTTAALLQVYLKEKTGIDVKIIPITENLEEMVNREQIDLILSDNVKLGEKINTKNLTIDNKIKIYYRSKIKEDLRFTTILDSLDKLSKNITDKDIANLTKKTKEGKEKRAVKEFLLQRGLW